MLYLIVEWFLSICSYALFALAELWLWITIIEGTSCSCTQHPRDTSATADDQNVSEEILDQLAELVDRNAQHFQGPAAPGLKPIPLEDPISRRASLRRASRDMRANLAQTGRYAGCTRCTCAPSSHRSKLAMVRTLQRDIMSQVSAYAAQRAGTKAAAAQGDSRLTPRVMAQPSKRRVKWKQYSTMEMVQVATLENKGDVGGPLECGAPVEPSPPSLTSPFVEVVGLDPNQAAGPSAATAPTSSTSQADQPHDTQVQLIVPVHLRTSATLACLVPLIPVRRRPQAPANPPAPPVDHSGSLRKRWRRYHARNTDSEAEEHDEQPACTAEEAQKEADDGAPRNAVVEYLVRPVYRGVLRPIGKRVHLLVSPQEEPKTRKKRFLSRRFLSAYGCVEPCVEANARQHCDSLWYS